MTLDYDMIVIGSGFGGSVSALRLSEKGYRVLVIEKGRRFNADDFPKSNWNFKKWFWNPYLRWHGFFKLTFFRHISVLSGVGVGGGSLVYANTLPVPKSDFFSAPSWSHLADWQNELRPFYSTAQRMLGVGTNPYCETGDHVLQRVAHSIARGNRWSPTEVGVFFGEPGKTVDDPYFDGNGPDRAGCRFCGACMIGCPHNAKNTLDKNYLYLAEKLGVTVKAGSEVIDVYPRDGGKGATGYAVTCQPSMTVFGKKTTLTCNGVIFAGGVLGTVDLLLKLKRTSLPRLSDRVGCAVRTNSESLLGVMSFDRSTDFSKGVAIGSILHTDDRSHIEPVRYPSGSGFWRILFGPMVSGSNVFIRGPKWIWDLVRHPIDNLRVFTVRDFARKTQILLFMQTIDSTLRFSRGVFGMKSCRESGPAPTPFIPEALDLAARFARETGGKPLASITETWLGIPSTAHILGGATMGLSAENGVIDKDHRVFGYDNMWVCDGSAVSANPGVNPSLTITALSERAMSKVAKKV
jgi:cholesterol oxidase